MPGEPASIQMCVDGWEDFPRVCYLSYIVFPMKYEDIECWVNAQVPPIVRWPAGATGSRVSSPSAAEKIVAASPNSKIKTVSPEKAAERVALLLVLYGMFASQIWCAYPAPYELLPRESWRGRAVNHSPSMLKCFLTHAQSCMKTVTLIFFLHLP